MTVRKDWAEGRKQTNVLATQKRSCQYSREKTIKCNSRRAVEEKTNRNEMEKERENKELSLSVRENGPISQGKRLNTLISSFNNWLNTWNIQQVKSLASINVKNPHWTDRLQQTSQEQSGDETKWNQWENTILETANIHSTFIEIEEEKPTKRQGN